MTKKFKELYLLHKKEVEAKNTSTIKNKDITESKDTIKNKDKDQIKDIKKEETQKWNQQ